jgi:hypothetical protein
VASVGGAILDTGYVTQGDILVSSLAPFICKQQTHARELKSKGGIYQNVYWELRIKAENKLKSLEDLTPETGMQAATH